MQDDMMLASMATQYVPTLPSSNPEPIDIHLKDDTNTNNTNTTSDTTMNTSKTTTSPAFTSAEPTSVRTEMNTQATESVTENTDQDIGPTSESQSALAEVNVKTDEDKSVTEANANPKSVEETTPTSSIPPEAPEYNHTMPTITQGATSETTLEEDANGDTVAGATVTPSTEMSAETEFEGPKPAAAEVEDAEATKIKSSIESPADQEPELSNTEATEPMDLDVVDDSGGEVESGPVNDHNPNTATVEVTQTQGGSDRQRITSKDASSADAPLWIPDPIPGTTRSGDTTAEVSRLHATYDSSKESRVSERQEEKMADDSVSGKQAECTSSNDGKVMATEPVVDSVSTATTSESTAEKEEEGTILPTKTQGSLFGGPDGKQISPTAEVPQTLKVDSAAQTETSKGFEQLFEDEMTDITTESNSRLQQSDSLDIGTFSLGANNTEDAEPNAQKDIELEAVLGAQQEVLSPPPSSDHDAKPDIGAYPSNTSPTYSHKTSSTNSQLSKKTSTTQDDEMNDLINSGNLYPLETEAKDVSAEYFDIEQTPSDTNQPVLPTIEEEQLCNCEFGYPCKYCKIREHNLRPGPRKDDYVNFGNHIPDTDISGDYTDDIRWYPSTQEVSREDRDEDEPSLEDREGDYRMSGGLISENTDLIGRFSNTIPFNKTDPLIRDKNPFEEESSSEDDLASKKRKKRRKENKSTRQPKRPKITDMTDITDDSDTQPAHRRRERSHVLPHLSTTLGTLSESLQRRQSGPGTPKPTKKTTPKRKKAPANTSSTQPTQTVFQMVQRIAKPLTTKLSYPINFNARSSCSICNCPSYAIIGTGSSRSIKIYDFGTGNREMPNANQAGKPQPMQPRPEETSLCLKCTTSYMKMLMCKTHDVVPLDVKSVFDTSAAFDKAMHRQCTRSELQGWCSLCPAPASYSCDKNCGAKFCDTCGSKLYGIHEGDLTAMLDQTQDKITHEYKHGLRADVELLRKGGELEKFLARMAAGAGRNRTG